MLSHAQSRFVPPRSSGSLCALCALPFFFGCQTYTPNHRLSSDVGRGDYGQARAQLTRDVNNDKREREYVLDRMRLGIVDLADGYPDSAERTFFETFMYLRRQGINDDKTVAAAVFGEGGTIFWKGEPFEQALAFDYIALTYAELGQWDNARAAAQASLFQLKNFGDNEKGANKGKRKTTEEVAAEAARREQQKPGEFDRYLDHGYTPTKTNFALGYFTSAVANLGLARADPDRAKEAADNFREAFTLAPGLKPVADRLLAGRANTVLVIDYGTGPGKERYGPSEALARFSPRTPSDNRPVSVAVNSSVRDSFPLACDVNLMATDHMWNNFEDVRKAKSAIGDLLMVGGTVALVDGSQGRRDGQGRRRANSTETIAGLGALIAGITMKETAKADLRYCEVMPQRTYVAAVNIPGTDSTLDIQVPGDESSRLVLTGVSPPPAGERFQVRYVRLPSGAVNAWAASGKVLYANDAYEERVPGDDLPYILGGRCVRTPSPETLKRYQSGGRFPAMTAVELENLYRAEGITISADQSGGQAGVHVLEGGRSLVTPLPGTTGYARLFGQEHSPYSPRSAEVQAVYDQIHDGPAGNAAPVKATNKKAPNSKS